MSEMKPLRGKRIVVTRAVEQARDLKDRLENLGLAEAGLLFDFRQTQGAPGGRSWVGRKRDDAVAWAAR
jgi:hypothetical protein